MKRFSLLRATSIAIAMAWLAVGCGGGGGGGAKTVDLTVSVPTTSLVKKSKSHKTVEVTEVKAVVLEDGTEVEATEVNGNYVVKVPEGSDVHLIATIVDENGSEFSFESFVNDAEESSLIVDEDSTRVANLLVNDGVEKGESVKDLLASKEDVLAKIREILESFESRDLLNNVLTESDSNESMDDLKEKVEEALKQLQECEKILALFEARLNAFQNSTDVVKFEALDEDDIKEFEDSDSNEGEFLNDFLVRPAGVSNIAVGEEAPVKDVMVYLNDDGSVSIERDGDYTVTDPIFAKGQVSGMFVSSTETSLTIGVKTDAGLVNQEYTFGENASDLFALTKSLSENDYISISLTETEDSKVVKAIYAEGFVSGTLTALTKTSVTVALYDGTSLELPFKLDDDSDDDVEILVEGIEPANEKKFDGENASGTVDETAVEVDETVEITILEEVDGVEVLSDLEDYMLYNIDAEEVAVGDAVIVHWKIVDNKKVALGIYPDRPIKIDDPILDSTEPADQSIEEMSNSGEVKN